MTYTPIYELLYGSKIGKQRVVELFSGDTINERWNDVSTGSASVVMNDAIDGGLLLQTGTTASSGATMDFNSKRQYDNTGSFFRTILKRTEDSGNVTYCGLTNNKGSGDYVFIDCRDSQTNYSLLHHNTSITWTSTGVARDTSVHEFMGSTDNTTAKMWVDGDLKAIATTQLPADKMEPFMQCANSPSANRSSYCRYFEAWNI